MIGVPQYYRPPLQQTSDPKQFVVSNQVINTQLFTQACNLALNGDHIQAAYKAELSEQQGNSGALFALGEMYETIPKIQNYQHAYHCYHLAAGKPYYFKAAALKMIKAEYQDSIMFQSQDSITEWSKTIQDQGETSDDDHKLNLLQLGELYLNNKGDWLSGMDRTDAARGFLTEIDLAEIPEECPEMRKLKLTPDTPIQAKDNSNFASSKAWYYWGDIL
jgi:hypothetical protein